MEPSPSVNLKMLFIGPEASGKSSLVRRLMTDTFSSEYRKTSGIEIGGTFFHDPTRIIIWDAAGDEAMKNITRSYYRSCNLAVVCFDCRKRTQFEELPHIVHEFKSLSQQPKDSAKDAPVQLLLVSTHSDCESERQVSVEAAEKFAVENDLHYLDFSSVTGTQQAIKAKVLEMVEKWNLSKHA